MTNHLEPYPNNKYSGALWLADIPAHWSVVRNGALFTQRRESGFPGLPILEVSLHTGVQVRNFEESNRKQIMSNLNGYLRAKRGDLAYNTMRMWQGAVGIAPIDGLVSPAYIVARPLANIDGRFYTYLYRTDRYKQQMENSSRGIVSDRNRLYWDQFKQMVSLFPPLDEQQAIARFLDRQDRRINRFIHAKRRMIELLNEQKQAIIHQAVTRGLDPNVPLKPSCIDWLGDIPAHWTVSPLRRHWEVVDCKHLTVEFTDSGYPLASVVQAQSFVLELSQSKFTDESGYKNLIEGGRKPVRGDLIYCRNTSVGSVAFVDMDVDFAMGQDVCLIRSKHQNQKYLNYFFSSPSMKSQLSKLMVGSTFKRINVEDIRSFTIVVPPRPEQDSITRYIEEFSDGIQKVVSRYKMEIDLIREYRTRLIADVVTGKLDVRKHPDAQEHVEDDVDDVSALLDDVVDDLTDEIELEEDDDAVAD